MKLQKSQLQFSVCIALFISFWRWYTNKNKKCKKVMGKSEVEEILRKKNNKLRKDLASKEVSLVTTKINYESLKNSENEAKTKCRRLIAELKESREKVKHWESLAKMNNKKAEASSAITLDGVGVAQHPKSTEGVEECLSVQKSAEPTFQIPKLEAGNPKSQTGDKGKKDILDPEIENMKKDLEAMRNKLSEREASHKAELEAVSRSEKEVVLKWKTENERLQKELEAMRVNKEADRKELIVLTKSLEESLGYQVKNSECLQEVSFTSSELNNYDSEATDKRAEELSKKATEILRLQKELDTASSKLKAREEADRNELVAVQKAAEGALAQQEARYKTDMAKMKDDLDIMQKKLNDQDESHKSQLAKVIQANESDVAKVEEMQFHECKNEEINTEEVSSLRTKLGKSEKIREEMMIRLEKEEQLREELTKQIEVYKEKLDKHQLNLNDFEAVQAAVSLFQGKLDRQNKQFEANRKKLRDATEQLELYKKKFADCEKREIDASARLQLELQNRLEFQKKEKELINGYEQREKERFGSVESEKKELRDELGGYKLKLSKFDQQLKKVLNLASTETVLGLQNKIEQMNKDAKRDAAAVQFLTAERDCATECLKISKRDRKSELILVTLFFLVVICVFCLWGKLDIWNKFY